MYGFHFDWLKSHADRTPQKLAQVDLETGRQFTYFEMNARANRLASFLRTEFGVQQGDRISLLAKNSSDYFEILFACSKIGAILNTLNWRLAVPELEYIINDCTPRILIYEPEFADLVEGLRPLTNFENHIIIGAKDAPPGEWNYETALAAGTPQNFDGPTLRYEDTWAILYTSGTTGRPKGAMVTYGNFFYNAVGMGQAINLNSQDINLVMLPTFHAGGLGLYAGPTFHAGGTVIVMRNFDPVLMFKTIQDWRVTTIILVPAMYLMLHEHPTYRSYDLSSIRLWSSGGSALPSSLVEMYAQDGIIIQQGMGMTETGPTVFLIPKADAVRKAGSVGKPVLHTEVCIMDQHHNKLGPNEVGELCIRGNITTGYWNAPEKTAAAIINGWLHSGDAAKYDEEGFYYLVDRLKDMFISGGENVYPAEIENLLYKHPAVAEAAVIGVPHSKWQEVGRAVIVVKSGQALTEEEVITFCQGKLARYKIPKAVTFIDALPRNDIGKVMKTELVALYGEPVG